MFPDITPDPITGEQKLKLEDFYNFLMMHGEENKASKIADQLQFEDIKAQFTDQKEMKRELRQRGQDHKAQKQKMKNLMEFLQKSIDSRRD